MRHARWLLLAALIAVIVAVGAIYIGRLLSAPRPAKLSDPLPAGIEATAQEWVYHHKNGDCPQLEVHAKKFRQIKEPSVFELEGVNLLMYQDCGKEYNQVRTVKAQFDTASGEMFSEGEAQITLGIPAGQQESESQIHVIASGVKFETKTGIAKTESEAKFSFEKGEGKCTGAEYDPNKHELHMTAAVELNLRAKTPSGKPMKIEAGSLVYFEKEAKVVMFPWSRLTRDTLVLNTEMSVAYIENKKLQRVESVKPWGVQNDPGRKIQYEAEAGTIFLNEDGEITNLKAERSAHLASTSDISHIDVKSDTLDLEFEAGNHESLLTHAVANGHSVVDSNPVAKPGAQAGETKILRADVIDMRMKPGGKEMDKAETRGPGSIEFIPNRAGQLHRTVNGDQMWVTYGAGNQIQSFRTVNAATRTDNPPKDKKPQPPTLTSSKEMRAEFDPKTHQIAQLEQTTNFKYEEGDRKAQADKAALDQTTNMMVMTGSARMLDPSGSASGDQIVIDRKSGDYTAEGHVSSTRMPDKKGSSSAMLNNDDPMQAKSSKMTSQNKNQLIRYEGNAVAWQGANRVQADKIEIDREEQVMKAWGSVVSQFVDKPKKDKDGKPLPQQTTVFTIVRAPEMTYTEEERIAVYNGGAVLNRTNLNVKSQTLRAFLKDKDADSSLDKAFADGAVVIVQTAPGRVRTGTSDHAEYYADDEKIILEKGDPKFVDSLKGTTVGRKLTYFSNDDRLLVEGERGKRAESVIRRK